MVDLPPDYVISTTLNVGTIYRFVAPELITTIIPHHFIVVAIDGNDNYLVVCTSQQAKKEAYFDNKELDYNGLVWIKPDSNNGFTTDTFVNCNEFHLLTKDELLKKCKEGVLFYIGKVSYNHYTQIRTGITASYVSDLPEDLLVHPEDSK